MDSKKYLRFTIYDLRFKNRGGYTLLVALLVMSIIMASSIALSGIVMQSLKISKGLDDAVVAFYAAESGIEENLYRISNSPPSPIPVCPSNSNNTPQPVFKNIEVSWTRICTVQGSEIALRATGIYRTSRMALQVRMPL